MQIGEFLKQDNRQDRVLAVLLSILYLVVVACAAAWLVGLLWGIINFLQTFGTYNATVPFPYFDPSPIPEQPYRAYHRGTFTGTIEDWINWNNAYFRGATRFGSGLGLIAGAIYAATTFHFKRAQDRLPIIVLAGVLIGARSMLMIASAPISAAAGSLVCAVVAVLLTALSVRDTRVPKLPKIEFSGARLSPTTD
jgi:hypothetical protein